MTTVVMVVGSDPKPNVKGQLDAAAAHYGRIVVVCRCVPGAGYQAGGWASARKWHYLEVPNLRHKNGTDEDRLAAETLLALKPAVCLSFGPCLEADLARQAGVTVYEV